MKEINIEINLEFPQAEIIVYKTDKFLVGLSLDGFNLDKRMYKLYTIGRDIKSSLAAGVIAMHMPKHALVDPFCGSGVIPIEAYLMINKSLIQRPLNYIYYKIESLKVDTPHYEEKSSIEIYAMDYIPAHVDITRKNAKVIGIDRQINISRIDPDMLSLKIDKALIITQGVNNEKTMRAFINELSNIELKNLIVISPDIDISKFLNINRIDKAVSGKKEYKIYVYR